jgi:hypothetical protein
MNCPSSTCRTTERIMGQYGTNIEAMRKNASSVIAGIE